MPPMRTKNKAYIVLADGHVFEGRPFGAAGCVTGEAVFATGMTGYLETLTDPSYFGQIVLQTFPLIGNYGVIPADFESSRPFVAGYIVSERCEAPSNFRASGTLGALLKERGIPGICGVDTRAITKIIRESGVMNARLVVPPKDGEASGAAGENLAHIIEESLAIEQFLSEGKINPLYKKILEETRAFCIKDAVMSVTGAQGPIELPAAEVAAMCTPYRAMPATEAAAQAGRGKRAVLWDFGAKANIRRELLKRGLEVVVMPAGATCADILAQRPDGVMLSNGPGDPAENTQIIEELARLCQAGVPLFGICLGHQLLALARDARTEKLKYGHRGANQPVKELATGRVYISSQNHGYAVVSQSLPAGAALSFINANDGTCEGVDYSDFPAFSVQFHPEASAGPRDTAFLFDRFVAMMR